MNGETLTKLFLNNQIVEMRKNIRQARIQCIGKMCREIRTLKGKKGTEEQIAKNLRKIDKFVEQMSIIKKINADIVSKFALQNEKSMTDITNNMDESNENKALARLACHKSVREKVLEFRGKFPNWKESLEPLLQSLGEKYQNKKQNVSKISSKKSEKHRKTKQENSTLHNEETKQQIPSLRVETINNSSGHWIIENSNVGDNENLDVLQNVSNLNDTSPENFSIANTKITKTTDSNKGNVNSELQTVTNPLETKINLKQMAKQSKPLIKCKSNTSFVGKNNDEKDCNSKKSSFTDVPQLAVDPFFITKDDKEYMSISAKTCSVEDSPEQNEKLNHEKLISKSERSIYKNKAFNQKSTHNARNGSQNLNVLQSKNSNLKRASIKTRDDSTSISLHPSWEAKKKLSAIIQNSQFQGKKIKFTD